jgi:anti-sigma-K factor RskA
MNQENQETNARDCGSDVAAYALGALDAHEVMAFEAHLDTCTVCRDELTAFQEVVDVLPMSAPSHPAPMRLRRRVMAAVAAEPKAGRHAPRERSWAPWLAGLSPRMGLAVAALAAVVIVAAGALALGGGTARTRVITAQVIGSSGTAQLRVTGGHAELVVHDLPSPPAGHIYEVWLARPGRAPTPTSALFSVTSRGAGDVDVPGSLQGVRVVMVTPEPAGGSRVPTHAAVIRAVLT